MSHGTTKHATKHGGCGCGGTGCCPVCRGLNPLERPRYFAGQLLTEDELSSEQAYLRDKNRLHNRFLHGWGIVCGLELACGDCPGYVTVGSGYALDPCGNDILVPMAQQFDVLAAIRVCQDAERRTRQDCDPYAPPSPDPCDGVSEHWCVSVRYEEQECRPTTALRHKPYGNGNGNGTGDCGCGCGGTKKANGNGGSCGCATKAPASSAVAIGACEPSRVLETFRLGVLRQCDDGCPAPVDELRRTFIGQVITCVRALATRFGKLSTRDRRIVLAAVFASEPDDASSQERYEALCRFRNLVRAVLEDQALSVHCGRLKVLDGIEISKPDGDEGGQQYGERVRAAFVDLTAVLVEHVRDCVCLALMPPCPADPCDDRVILGCVEVRDGEIVQVCGWSGRRYAGSFPALGYWLSFAPALAWAICKLCCAPRASFGKQGKETWLVRLLDNVDPTGSLRRSAYADDFAAPRGQLKRLLERLDKVRRPENWNDGLRALLGLEEQ